jgi:hypothetical protein
VAAFKRHKQSKRTTCPRPRGAKSGAILGAPDGQQVDEDEYDGYFSLTDDAAFVRIAEPVSGRSRGWVLAIAGQWVRSETNAIFGMEGASLQIDLSEARMSGSPILDRYGRAIGLVSIGDMSDAIRDQGCKHGPNPILVLNLPEWLLQ